MATKRAVPKNAAPKKALELRRVATAYAHTDQVREVTNIQAVWQGNGSTRAFVLKLVLDNGVQEHLLSLDAQEMKVLLGLFRNSGHVTFDTGTMSLKFTDVATK